MNIVEIHRAWAPENGRWSRWVKPVLFAELDEHGPLPAPDAELERRILAPLARQATGYRAGVTNDTALVIDLPGAEGTYLGISLASQGFRPIPLYNAIPSPAGLVDLAPIVIALRAGAEQVSSASPAAPPAFLLDATRLVGGRVAVPGRFDNRSVCCSSDFPSAAVLASAGISRVIIVSHGIQGDLGDVLFDWQNAGISLLRLPTTGEPEPFVHRRPFFLRRWMASLFGNVGGPRPRADGMFGDLIVGPAAG